MSRNKKVFKYQRKEMLVSNPLAQPAMINASKELKVKQETKQLPINVPMQQVSNDKLEIPKQMRMDNIAHKVRSRLIAMMDSHPLFEVDSLFENETVCRITGIMAKSNRDSFSKRVKQSERQLAMPAQQGYVSTSDMSNKQLEIPSQYQPPQANYLDMLSDGVAMKHIPLEQAFESSQESERGGTSWRQVQGSNNWPHGNNRMEDQQRRIERRRKRSHNSSESTGIRFY